MEQKKYDFARGLLLSSRWNKGEGVVTETEIQDFMKKITIKDNNSSPHHFQLFDASQKGDYETFMKLAPACTENDLEWAQEVCTHLDILKYMVEERKIEGFVHSTFYMAIKYNKKDILNYLRDKFPKFNDVSYVFGVAMDGYKSLHKNRSERKSSSLKHLQNLKRQKKRIEKFICSLNPTEDMLHQYEKGEDLDIDQATSVSITCI